MIFANPFPFSASVYPKVKTVTAKVGLEKGRKNLRFLHHVAHPAVDRNSPCVSPGWNSSSGEILATKRHGSCILFDRDGSMVFRGRASFEEIEKKIRRLVRKR
ncbi:MAG: hypothetical protein CMJ83_20310 [Planctomycetes bacterium]|jgi:hypothetical protein|nr:hypothetical protein [Planctomycetota bacterium]